MYKTKDCFRYHLLWKSNTHAWKKSSDPVIRLAMCKKLNLGGDKYQQENKINIVETRIYED